MRTIRRPALFILATAISFSLAAAGLVALVLKGPA
jgi:hypothetical protein